MWHICALKFIVYADAYCLHCSRTRQQQLEHWQAISLDIADYEYYCSQYWVKTINNATNICTYVSAVDGSKIPQDTLLPIATTTPTASERCEAQINTLDKLLPHTHQHTHTNTRMPLPQSGLPSHSAMRCNIHQQPGYRITRRWFIATIDWWQIF